MVSDFQVSDAFSYPASWNRKLDHHHCFIQLENFNPMLEKAVKASLWQLAVYDEKELVAYIRLVGDGHSVLLVQDLLVRPDYQRQGIGKKLLEKALETFPHVYQRLLVTERSEKNLDFYQSLGFVELSEQACTGMIYNN